MELKLNSGKLKPFKAVRGFPFFTHLPNEHNTWWPIHTPNEHA